MSEWFKDSRGVTIPFIRIGRVITNSDPKGIGELKVRIDGVDKLDGDEDLISCLPLLPKFLNVFPEPGQAVYIIQSEHQLGPKTSTKTKRYWIGPLVSQLQNLEDEQYKGALSQEIDGYTNPDVSIDSLPASKGAYPNKKDIAIQGKDNTDICFRPKEVQIRVGKFTISDNLKFNKKDPGYIQLKYGNTELKKEFETISDTRKVIVPPTHIIKAQINSFLPDGTPLDANLQPEQYQESKRHSVTLTVRDIENNDVVYTFNNNGDEYASRSEAVNALKDEVDGQKDSFEKWKIITPTYEILDHLGEDIQQSKIKQTILYPNNTKTVTTQKTIEKIKKSTTSEESSVVNIVASKINLISHDGEHDFDITDPESLITNKTQKRINTEAHPIVYGDKLIDYLNLVKTYIRDHTHPEHQLVAVDSIDKRNALNFDLETILNKNVNSN